MPKHYWLLSRPKRKLIIVPELLKIFSAVAVGKKWTRNRALQQEFEKRLVEFQWKAQNLSADGSGSRTYATLLSLLGLWYEDEDGVKLTKAGEELVRDEPPVPILTKQIINFQYPSAYSVNRWVNVDPSIKVRPHRFIITLLMSGLDILTQDEIAYCVVPFVTTDQDLSECLARIQQFRSSKEQIISEALRKSQASAGNLSNIANTFINQLEYTGFFAERDENNAPLCFSEGGRERAEEAIDKYGRSIAAGADDEITYQKRYGSGLETKKDYTHSTPIPPSIDPNERLALMAYYEISLKEPINGIDDVLIQKISSQKGIPYQTVKKVLDSVAEQPMMDRFEEMYIKLSKGGRETATDFEIKTNGVLSDSGFGFASVWVGPKPRHPDIFLYFDKVNKKHGILDTKAYSKYTLPLDHKTKMANIYVPLYKKLEFEGEEYSLEFFSYIAGGFGPNMSTSFKELLTMADADGSYISSYNFMRLLRLHREEPFSAKEFGAMFSSNREIEYDAVKVSR